LREIAENNDAQLVVGKAQQRRVEGESAALMPGDAMPVVGVEFVGKAVFGFFIFIVSS
jgi:hypothetical protein